MEIDLLSGSFYILIFFLTFTYGLFTHKFNYWKRRQIPFIEPRIPFGNVQGISKTKHSSQLMKTYYDQHKTNKFPFCGIYMFTNPFALICDLDLVRHILIKDFTNFTDRGLYYNEKDDPISAHLLALDGNKWKELRSKLTPTFTLGKMKFMFPTVVQVAEQFQLTLRQLYAEANSNLEIEIKDIMARFTTDVIGTCAFGIECNSLNDPNAEFRQMGKMVFDNPKNSGISQLFMLTFPEFARKFHMTSTHPKVSEFFLRIVRETIEHRRQNNIKRNDFLDILIQLLKTSDDPTIDAKPLRNSERLTIVEITAQVYLFFLAGFETSSTALTFCLYELAVNQDIQDKARNEIRSVLAKHNGEFTYDAQMEMTFVDQCINESLRKYPPAASIIRKTRDNYLVPGTDKYIDKGTTIWIPVYAIHHDPDIYPEPDKFDPTRFESDLVHERHSCSFLAFGEGPRNCIGLRFGMMQARVGLVLLLKNLRFTICDRTPQPLVLSKKSFILSPESGLWLKVEPFVE